MASELIAETVVEVLLRGQPKSVMLLRCSDVSLAAALSAHGVEVVDVALVGEQRRDIVALQLDRRFDLVWLNLDAQLPEHRIDSRALVHAAVQHLVPSGLLAVEVPESELDGYRARDVFTLCGEFDLVPERHGAHGDDVALFRRTERFTVHDLVFEARASICRVTPAVLHERLSSARRPLVIDTRTATDRARFGVIDGAIHAPRTVIEWHLDPANGYRHRGVTSFDQSIVVVCNGGYSSSLAAANLVRLGFTDVSDLIGGMHAWRAAGLPVVTADHSHLDL
jgi:rhodanese-related sulfurtransferase